MATQRLTASDITSKIATGTPMGRNELLPDVPEGMSARGFYGQFPGGASAYSQAPFKRSSDATDTFDPTEEEATADTSSTETQMENVLSSSLDTSVRDESNTSEGMGESSSLDNIALTIPNELFNWEEIKEDYNNFDTIEKIEEVLKNGKNNIIAAANKGVNEFLGEINALGKEIATITEEGPLNYIGRHITDSIGSVIGIISDPFSKISINTSLTYIGKSVGSNLLSGLFTSLGFGLASTPLGMITVAALSGVDLEEGQKGRHFDNSTQENPNTIAGYNSEGVAVNADGEPGLIDGMFAFKSIGDWMENIGKSFSEIEEDARASKMSADYDFVSGQEDGYTDVLNDPFAEQYQSALDREEGIITPQNSTYIGPTWNGSTPPTNYSNLNPAIYDGLNDPLGFIEPPVFGEEPPIDFNSKYFIPDKNPPAMKINTIQYTPFTTGAENLGPEAEARFAEDWDYENSGELSGWSAGSMDHTGTSGQATGHDDGYEDNSGDGDSGGGMDDGGGYGGVGGDDW